MTCSKTFDRKYNSDRGVYVLKCTESSAWKIWSTNEDKKMIETSQNKWYFIYSFIYYLFENGHTLIQNPYIFFVVQLE